MNLNDLNFDDDSLENDLNEIEMLEASVGDISTESNDVASIMSDDFGNVFLSDDDDAPPQSAAQVLRPPDGGAIPFLPSPNDVCFKHIKHKGTKRWRAVVKKYSDQRVEFPKWNKEIFDLIKRDLAHENITRFLISLDGMGVPSTKVKEGMWYIATSDEIMEKTKERFTEDRKTRSCPERRLSSQPRGTASVAPSPSVPIWPPADIMAHFQKSSAELLGLQNGLEQELQRRSPNNSLVALQEVETNLSSLLEFVRRQRKATEGNVLVMEIEMEGLDESFGIERLSWCIKTRSIWAWGRRLRGTVRLTNFRLMVIVAVQIAIVTAAILLGVLLPKNRSSNQQGGVPPLDQPVGTLDSIKARGYMNCGVVENPGFAVRNASGAWSGFEVDLCRAVGASIFSEDNHVNFTSLSYDQRFSALLSQQVDLVAAGATFTMERDLYEPSTKAGFTFSVPYLYDGISFAGVPKYVACADQRLTTGNCTGIKICVQDGTSHVPVLESLFPNFSVIILVPSTPDFYSIFVKELCNVLAGDQFDLAQNIVRQAGYTGDYIISASLYSKEPIALVTRDDDAVWSDFVNWVLLSLLTAERMTITQSVAQAVITNPDPAVDLSQIPFFFAIASVGNYAEMYQRHLAVIVPRASLNEQNNGTGSLIYTFPFGNVTAIGRGPDVTLQKILLRGHLVCGVTPALFFATLDGQNWDGFHVDYCRAVSAAIFGDTRDVTFMQPNNVTTRWELLASGDIDIISGSSWNYARDVNETHTRTGFTFTQPTFYTGVQLGGIPPYGDCANNVDIVSGNCYDLMICVASDRIAIDVILSLFVNPGIYVQRNVMDVYQCLESGLGNVIVGSGYETSTAAVRDSGYSGPYQTDSRLFSRSNLALVTRQDDPQWSSFVFWVVNALSYAEEHGITQATFQNMPTTNLFGTELTTMWQDAVRAVGSRGEILKRNAKGKYSIGSINTLNTPPYGPGHFPPAGLYGLY